MAFAPIIAAVITAASAAYAADQSRRQAHAQQDAAAFNQEIDKQNSVSALQAASANEDAQRRRAGQILGSQRAALAQAGSDLSTTGDDLYKQSAANAELDALNIRYGGAMQSRAQLTQSSLDLMSANAASQRASAATTQGYLGVGSAALNGYGRYTKGSSLNS